MLATPLIGPAFRPWLDLTSATTDVRSVLAALVSTHNRLDLLLLAASHSSKDISTDSKCELHFTHSFNNYLIN